MQIRFESSIFENLDYVGIDIFDRMFSAVCIFLENMELMSRSKRLRRQLLLLTDGTTNQPV